MNGKEKKHSVDTIFVLSLFCVFAVAVLLSLIMGTKSYSVIRERGDDTFYRRTAISYLAEKLRHDDKTQGIYLSEFHGMHALELRSKYDDVDFSTYIYLYEGKICELFCETGLDLPEDAGVGIIEGSLLQFEMQEENLLKITYGDPMGGECSVFIALRSKDATFGAKEALE